MLPVLVRIGLRYLAGALVAKGFLAPEMGVEIANDMDLQALIEIGAGLAIGAATEAAYYLARRLGWAT